MDPVMNVRPTDVGAASFAAGASSKDGAGKAGEGFGKMLDQLVGEADSLQKESDAAVRKFATGEIEDVHQVMLSMNRADLSFRMMLEVRNKLMDAYSDVMRMQV